MRIIIDSNRVYREQSGQQKVIRAASPFIYMESKNGEIRNIRFIKNLKLNYFLDSVKSVQELVVEENKLLLVQVIEHIKKIHPEVQSVLIKEVPCISENFKVELLKVGIKVESNDFVTSGEENLVALYRVGVRKLVQWIWENNQEVLGDISGSEERRLKLYIQRQAPKIITQMKKKKNTELDFKVISKERTARNISLNVDIRKCNLIGFDKELSIKEKYEMREKYKVVMISPFSFGKSTLINALIGKQLLQADVRAETANITKIIWNKQKRILSEVLLEGKSVYKEYNYNSDIDLRTTLQGLTSVREEGNSLNQINILGENGIDKGITLIDSPGLFSRYEQHDNLSQQALLSGDMIIFIMSPEHVGESNFTEMIRSYRDYLIDYKKDICFVLTKRDMYDGEEEQKVLRETQIVLEEMGFTGTDVFFVSAYIGLKCMLFKEGIITFDELRKDRVVFLEEDGELIRGKNLKEDHLSTLMKYSNIEALKKKIISVKEKYNQRCNVW